MALARTTGGFDRDDVGAMVGQQHGRVRSGNSVGKIHHGEIRKRLYYHGIKSNHIELVVVATSTITFRHRTASTSV
jgi:hypothetical protein